jgi:hypothetical protein
VDPLERIVAEQRLGAGRSPRRRFTVSRVDALLAARSRTRDPWAFTIPWLRAALLLCRRPWICVRTLEERGHEVVELELGVPGVELGELHLAGLLMAGLEADRDPAGPEDVARAWSRLVGRGINEALAEDPAWLELAIPGAGRRWVRGTAPGGDDPYFEQALAPDLVSGRFRLRIARPQPSIGHSVRAWFVGRGDPLAGLHELWRDRFVGDLGIDGDLTSFESASDPVVDFAGRGGFTPCRGAGGPWLVRQSMRLVRLEEGLPGVGIRPEAVQGWVQFADVVLTASDHRVVEDRASDEMFAWLADVVRCGFEPAGAGGWPEVDRLRTVEGAEVEIDALGSDGSSEALFVWAPHAGRLPIGTRAGVLSVWPSELEVARRRREDLVWIPVMALGRMASAPRIDLGALSSRSFPPISISVDPLRVPVSSAESGEVVVTPSVHAFVHRYPGDVAGRVIVSAYGRRITRISEAAEVVPGTTLVVEIGDGASGSEVPDLPSSRALSAVVQHAVDATFDRFEHVIGTTMGHLSGFEPAWHVPVIADEIARATGATLGLHYRHGPDGEVYLAWASTPLLALDIGRTRDGRPCRLIDALLRVRDVGGIVAGDVHRRWYELESSQRDLETWILHDRGRALVERVLHATVVWDLPIVPESMPRPISAGAQRHLLLDADSAVRKLERHGQRSSALVALQAHLLVARITGAQEHGLGTAALFTRYDPRALVERTQVSLDVLEQEPVWPLLCPPTTAGRWLPRPAVEVTPPIAHLLDEYRACETSPMHRPSRRGDAEAMVPRRAGVTRRRGEAALATVSVTDVLAVGALHVDPAHDDITLWARGLSIGSFRLPSPLRSVSGRLWLTDAGISAGHGRILAACIEHARQLFEVAVQTAACSPPDSERRGELDRFIAGVRTAIDAGRNRLGIALPDDAGPERDSPGRPPAMRGLPDAWLGPLVRYALGRPVQLESARLSWRAARVMDANEPGRIELGRLDGWIRRALTTDATTESVLLAACLVVAEAVAAVPAWGPVDLALERLLVACPDV